MRIMTNFRLSIECLFSCRWRHRQQGQAGVAAEQRRSSKHLFSCFSSRNDLIVFPFFAGLVWQRLGQKLRKCLFWGPRFTDIFYNLGNNVPSRASSEAIQLPWSLPLRQASAFRRISHGSGHLTWLQALQNCGSQMVMFGVKLCQPEIATGEFRGEHKGTCACQSTDWLSVILVMWHASCRCGCREF